MDSNLPVGNEEPTYRLLLPHADASAHSMWSLFDPEDRPMYKTREMPPPFLLHSRLFTLAPHNKEPPQCQYFSCLKTQV